MPVLRCLPPYSDISKKGLLCLNEKLEILTYQNQAEVCNHFKELQTKLFEVELIINDAPLIYAYSNTFKTYSIPNHLLFGIQLLLSYNTTSTVPANPTVLSNNTDKINRISNHFWDRWRHAHVVNLRETQRISKLNTKRGKITQTLLENCH